MKDKTRTDPFNELDEARSYEKHNINIRYITKNYCIYDRENQT